MSRTSTRSWMRVHWMPGVTASPAVCLMALVASSLVSRTATSLATERPRHRWPSGPGRGLRPPRPVPLVSRTRHACDSAARVGAIVGIGFLNRQVGAAPPRGVLRGCSRGRSEHVVTCPGPVAQQMLLQIAARDIRQLPDIELHVHMQYRLRVHMRVQNVAGCRASASRSRQRTRSAARSEGAGPSGAALSRSRRVPPYRPGTPEATASRKVAERLSDCARPGKGGGASSAKSTTS